MTVDIQCEGCGGVAKVPLNCLDVIAGANGGNGEGVTQIVEAGIRAALFDISLEEAALQVSHTSTWSSFYNLLEGNVDLVFSCPLSETQY